MSRVLTFDCMIRNPRRYWHRLLMWSVSALAEYHESRDGEVEPAFEHAASFSFTPLHFIRDCHFPIDQMSEHLEIKDAFVLFVVYSETFSIAKIL